MLLYTSHLPQPLPFTQGHFASDAPPNFIDRLHLILSAANEASLLILPAVAASGDIKNIGGSSYDHDCNGRDFVCCRVGINSNGVIRGGGSDFGGGMVG